MSFTYDLPPDRIAQRPVHPAHDARMITVDRASGEITSRTFLDIPALLSPADLIVFNDTKVIPARFFGTFTDSDTEAEVLLVKRVGRSRWRCLGKPLRRFREGRVINFAGSLSGKIFGRVSEKEVEVEFFSRDGDSDLHDLMEKTGLMPVPPYIRGGHSDDQDRVDYQTIFAGNDGSIAAPTASLHFTDQLLSGIRERGCRTVFLTLHVGTASFLPLESGGARPGKETLIVPRSLFGMMEDTKTGGGRVIAAGTTVVRALESAARSPDAAVQGCETDLFITPGFEFQAVDSLITNFHQPDTTHLLLVEAFMGGELLEKTYQYALENEYRFLSYGDGMWVV